MKPGVKSVSVRKDRGYYLRLCAHSVYKKKSYQISVTKVYINPKDDEATGLRNPCSVFAQASGLSPDTPK